MSFEGAPEINTVQESTPEKMAGLAAEIMEEADKIEIKENDKNKEGYLLVSPDGPVSNLGKQSELWWKMARTEKFKEFFGDWKNNPEASSKIVDQNGEPLVVFRGLMTDVSLSDFYNEKYYNNSKSNSMNILGSGMYTTPFPEEASSYASEQQGGMFPLFVNARNPVFRENIIYKAEKLINDNLFMFSKLFKLPENISLGMYDAVFGYKKRDVRGSEFDPKQMSKPKHIEETYELAVKNSDQVLIIPNTIEKIKKSIIDTNRSEDNNKN